MYIPNPTSLAGCDTRSIFKRSLTGLNPELSFSLTGCLTKAKKLSLLCYLPIVGGRIIGFIAFLTVLVLCELGSPCLFPTTLTITPRVSFTLAYRATF